MAIQDLKITRWLITMAKNSPWLMIAVGLHVILAAVMSVMYIHRELKKDNAAATQIAVSTNTEPIQEIVQPVEEIDRKKIPDNEQQSELVTYEEETTFVPTEEVEQDLYQDIGDPTGAEDGSEAFTGGTAIGVGTGGHYGTGTPSSFVSRRPGTKNKGKLGRLPKGATQGTEEAVLEGLRWLIRHQEEDGSWSTATLATHCSKTPCIPPEAKVSHNYDEGLTALALLCFLGQGISINSKIEVVDTAMGKSHKAGEVVKKGIRWLIDRQNEDGSFCSPRPFLYSEALASMAIFEAYALSHNRELKRPAQKAVEFLCAAQKLGPDGTPWGWRYTSKTELDAMLARGEIDQAGYEEEGIDISVTGWVVMALKSADLSGIDVPDEAMQGALKFANYVSKEDGLVGYQHPRQAGEALRDSGLRDHFTYHTGTMSALGMLVRTFVQHDLDDPFLEAATKHIVKDLPEVTKDKLSIDYYYWYYATLALNQFDGPDSPRKGSGRYWEPWNKALIDVLLDLQDKSKERDVCTRGAWLTEDRWGGNTGYAIYNTALSVLTLEVYYRYENAFGLTAAGKAKAPAPAAAPAVEAAKDSAEEAATDDGKGD